MKILIAFIFGLLATCLTDLTFWRTLIEHKTIWATDEHNGVKNSFTLKDFLSTQFLCFIAEFGISISLFDTLTISNRLSIFILTSMFCLIFFKVFAPIVSYKKPNFRQCIPWIIIFVLYILLFIQDFYVFDKVNVEENHLSHEKVSEIISDASLEISGDDLLKLDAVDASYYSNGRILLCSSNGILVLHENNAEFIECTVLESNKVPDEISTKSAVQLGVFVDNKNQPYIVYALMKKTSFLGSYKTDQYALYNLVEEKIDAYCNDLPDWAKY